MLTKPKLNVPTTRFTLAVVSVSVPLLAAPVLHDIYHTPFDEPSRIEYPKLTRMAKWMYATGWAVSETRDRPAIDPGYKFSR